MVCGSIRRKRSRHAALNLRLFGSTFLLIFLAELPDKTALTTLFLASRHPALPVFIGGAAALALQSVIAVGLGALLGLLPPTVVRLGAGILFLTFAVVLWMKKESLEQAAPDDRAAGHRFWKVAGTSFAVCFLAEWGDLTQLSTATLTARYGDPLTIFCASMLALWSVCGISAAVGHSLKKWINPRPLQKIAAAAFACVGIILLVRA